MRTIGRTIGRYVKCPACAERIRREAVVCRFCGRDVAPPDSSDATDTDDRAELADPVGASPPIRDEGRPYVRRILLLVAVLAIATSVIVSILAFQAWDDSQEIRDARIARDKVRTLVAAPVEDLLTYDHKTLDADFSNAEDGLTEEFAAEYAPTIDEVRDRAMAQKRTQVATVVAVAPLSYGADRADILVFVNTVASREGSRRQQILQNRLLVSMVRDADDWLISGLSIPVSG